MVVEEIGRSNSLLISAWVSKYFTKTSLSILSAVMFNVCHLKVATNVLGIAEGGEIEAESFDFAPRLAKTNFYELNLRNKNE